MTDATSQPDPDLVAIRTSAPGPVGIAPNAPARKKKRLACVPCRQAKLKCVGAGRGLCCEACRRKGLQCEVDADYKRVNQSWKLRHLSDEVKRLKDIVASSSPRERVPDRALGTAHRLNEPAGSLYHDEIVTDQNESSLDPPPGSGRPILQNSPSRIPLLDNRSKSPGQNSTSQGNMSINAGAYMLEKLTLAPEQVTRLFQIFFQYFHPHFPLLNKDVSANGYHERSPLLFWTIMATASRAYREQPELCTRLSQPVTALLWSKIAAIPPSHFTIQAAILLCVWPFPPPMMIADPTLYLTSVAKAGCMQLGMHQPEHMQDYNRVRFEIQPVHVQEATQLWVACFIAGQTISTADGYAPLFNTHDKVLDRATATDELPPLLKQMLRVAMLLNRLHTSLGQACAHSSLPQSSAGPLIVSFENELDQLGEDLYRSHQTRTVPPLASMSTPAELDYLAIWIAAARLHIQALYFLESAESSYRKPGLLRAFASGVELIRIMHTANMQPNFNHSAPRYFGQALKLAALVVLRLHHSCYSLLLDGDESRHYFGLAIDLHRSMIVENNDFHDRATIILLDLWDILDHDQHLQKLEPTLKLQTRQSASLLHDSQWVWRDHYAARSIDTQQLGRPPRVLPSIIQYSPVSNPLTTSPNASMPQQASTWGTTPESGEIHASHRENALADGEQFADLPVLHEAGSRPDRQRNSAATDVQLDPLDMMYAFLDPNDEASELFYPSWAVDNEGSLTAADGDEDPL